MTVIAGIELEGGVALAWDTAITDGLHIDTGCEKVRLLKPWLAVGFAGDVDVTQLFWHEYHAPKTKPRDVVRFMEYELPRALAEIQHSTPDLASREWQGIVACCGELWNIGGGSYRPSRGYTAIGSGMAFAMGAIWKYLDATGYIQTGEATELVIRSVRCACDLGTGVRVNRAEPVPTLWVPR